MLRFSVLFVAIALAACQPPARLPIRSGADVDAILATEAQFGAAFERRDAVAAARFYDSDATITQPLASRDHCALVRVCYETLFADPNGAITVSAHDNVEVSASHDLAVSSGECIIFRTSTRTHQREPYSGGCMRSWRRGADGHWRIAWEMRINVVDDD